MARNLLGELYYSAEDIAKELLSLQYDKFDLFQNFGTKQGFTLSSLNSKANPYCNGFYIIYRDNKPLYIGYSMSNSSKGIYNRISRFVKEVFQNSNPSEKHPAANKYRYIYGSTLMDLKVVIIPYANICKKQAEQIENNMIYLVKPLLNVKKIC